MFKKILKISMLILGSIILLLIAFYAFIYHNVNTRIHKTYEGIPAESFAIPSDSETIALGEHLSMTKGCQECHGENLAGKVMIDDPALGRIVTPNLTKGKGGLPADYSHEDWIKSLRHGVSRENKPFLLMPSEEFTHLTQHDLAAVIAYCKQLPPVDNELPDHQLKPLAYALIYFDQLPLIVAEKIDHSQKVKPSVDINDPITYGKYLSVSCIGCHKEDFKGGDPVIPDSPQVADITTTGNIDSWTEDQFIQVLRTGQTPEGKSLQNEFMPWQMTKQYTDHELKSLYAFLKTQ